MSADFKYVLVLPRRAFRCTDAKGKLRMTPWEYKTSDTSIYPGCLLEEVKDDAPLYRYQRAASVTNDDFWAVAISKPYAESKA